MPHVMASKWAPQISILQHPKTVVFLAHCGYKSLREAIRANVPVLAMPFFGDQFRNAAMLLKLNIGQRVDKTDFQKSAKDKQVHGVL
ncbi:UDPGT domain containing protein [Trichuris trichiura]|uniref:UDP-glucuronosyltransferase n=1 Tax=Trichuris trichiura TaxID=36087 RepID=A0A077YVV2_TRITR|nr:UDPGT domain containing protein [Trichuris trichiura]